MLLSSKCRLLRIQLCSLIRKYSGTSGPDCMLGNHLYRNLCMWVMSFVMRDHAFHHLLHSNPLNSPAGSLSNSSQETFTNRINRIRYFRIFFICKSIILINNITTLIFYNEKINYSVFNFLLFI